MSGQLEEMKEWFYDDEELHQFQIEWLFKQAEKAEQYEKSNEVKRCGGVDYEEAWKETKKLIEGAIDYMNLQIETQIEMSSNGTIECKRLMSKREGFEVVKQYMHNSEKIYKG